MFDSFILHFQAELVEEVDVNCLTVKLNTLPRILEVYAVLCFTLILISGRKWACLILLLTQGRLCFVNWSISIFIKFVCFSALMYKFVFKTMQAAELIDSEFRPGMSNRQKNKAKRMAKLVAKQRSRDMDTNEKRLEFLQILFLPTCMEVCISQNRKAQTKVKWMIVNY